MAHDLVIRNGLLVDGTGAPARRADVGDMNTVGVRRPRMVNDLPTSGSRLLQSAFGSRATIAGGAVTMDHCQHTGELPGRVIRGRQGAPT